MTSSHHLEQFLLRAERDPALSRALERVEDAAHLCRLARAAGFQVEPEDLLRLRRSRRREAMADAGSGNGQRATTSASAF